jgi:hypothetical protein
MGRYLKKSTVNRGGFAQGGVKLYRALTLNIFTRVTYLKFKLCATHSFEFKFPETLLYTQFGTFDLKSNRETKKIEGLLCLFLLEYFLKTSLIANKFDLPILRVNNQLI